MTIHGIIKNAIKRLKLEDKLLTPDFYSEAFCKEARKAGIKIEDCKHLDKLKKGLNKNFQKDLVTYRINTIDEFVRYLVSKLNRTDPSKCSDTLDAQNILMKRILQVIEVLHNEQASELARKSIELLNNHPDSSELNHFRQLWINFLTTYDDTFLQKLKTFGTVNTNDLKSTIEHLNLSLPKSKNHIKDLDLSEISSLLVASLVPSIASDVNDTIAILSDKIRYTPEYLGTTSFVNEVESAIALRISLDKQSVKDMVESLDGVLDKLSLRLIDMIEKSHISNIQIKEIKKELKSYSEESSSNFKIAHKKLYTIAVALEENTEVLGNDLKNNSQEVKDLSVKIQHLEKELEKVKKESKTDFLTKLYNKRALDEVMQLKEAEFQRYNHNFSFVMFDLDLFKKVNDTYGHEAGDAVLSAFAKILQKECRSVDIVGRFGGEEFLAVLSDTNVNGGATFAQKVREHVQKARFIYKGKRILVTVSAGVSERKEHISIEAALNSADEYLYTAKKNGRNQVAYKKK